MAIKSRLRVLMAEKETKEGKRLSIKQLARETGLAESTLHSLANNTTQRFDAPILEALCSYFGVPLSELLIFYPEGDTLHMDNSLPEQHGVFDQLKQFYPQVIAEMDNEFRSHQFILQLAERHQQEYIAALASYVDNRAPFMIVHRRLATMLHDFEPDLVELIAESVPSHDIWGNSNNCSYWQKTQ